MTAKQDSLCVECGPHVMVDEDGCCAACGASAMGPWADKAAAALDSARELERAAYDRGLEAAAQRIEKVRDVEPDDDENPYYAKVLTVVVTTLAGHIRSLKGQP